MVSSVNLHDYNLQTQTTYELVSLHNRHYQHGNCSESYLYQREIYSCKVMVTSHLNEISWQRLLIVQDEIFDLGGNAMLED